MGIITQQAYDAIVKNFDTAYTNYRLERGLSDDPVVRLGFYSVVEEIVHNDPIANPQLQIMVEEMLDKAASVAIDEAYEAVEDLVVEE